MKGPASGGKAEAVAIVLLAAGLSRRFRSAKQLHPWQGRPLVRHMAATALASRADRVVVVTGAYRAEVEAALAGAAVELAHNPDFAQGQSTSVRRGLEAAPGSAAAILFLPVDMPFLETATLDLLIEAWHHRRPAAVAPLYAGQRGAPVLFDRRLFPELAELQGDQGGRAVLARHPGELREVEIGDERQGRDLDTPEDLARTSAPTDPPG